MILQRMTIRFKFRKREEAFALLKAETARGEEKGFFLSGHKVLKPWRYADLIELECIWESHAQMVEMWNKWGNDPGSKLYLDSFRPLVKREKNEFFDLD